MVISSELYVSGGVVTSFSYTYLVTYSLCYFLHQNVTQIRNFEWKSIKKHPKEALRLLLLVEIKIQIFQMETKNPIPRIPYIFKKT